MVAVQERERAIIHDGILSKVEAAVSFLVLAYLSGKNLVDTKET